MTCIVAVKAADGALWMGGDSLASAGSEACVRVEPKVARRGAFLFGRCGDTRACQVAFYAFMPPAHPETKETLTYLVTDFVAALRATLAEHHVHLKDEEMGAGLLIGYRGRLFTLDGGFGVGEYVDDYAAIGSGEQVARGALHATKGLGAVLTPERRLSMALEAASHHEATVRGPFTILRSGEGE